MIANERSLKIAEEQLDHKLRFGTAESKAERHNVAKDTEYDYNPELDGDIITSKKNLADTQVVLKHKWVIEDLQSEADLRLNLQA